MRRKDKLIHDREEIDGIIGYAEVCRLSMIANGAPYLVPLNFGYDGNSLYFHSAREGKKIDALKRDGRVWFEVEGPTRTVSGGLTACKWTMEYISVMGSGHAVFVDDPAEKRRAFDLIMSHYAPKTAFAFEDSSLDRVTVIRVAIDSVEGKTSQVPMRTEA